MATRVEITPPLLQAFLARPQDFELETFLDIILALCMAEIGAQIVRVDSNPELWCRPLPARWLEKRRR